MDSPSPPPPRTRFISHIRIRVQPPSVMLVRIDPEAEPAELGLDDLFVRVLRVRHPLPACQRMRIMKPLVIIVGEGVCDIDRQLLIRQAREIGAAFLQLGPLLRRESLGTWLRDAIQLAAERRAERGEDVEQVAVDA